MKLEDELKQTKPFENELQKLILNIGVTSSWLNSLMAEKLKPHDISPQQYNVLRILRGRYPDSYCNQDIAQRMIDKSSNVTRIVDKLLDKGFVSRSENSLDRRLVNIVITEKGLELLKALDCVPSAAHAKLSCLSEEKIKLMNEWLDEMRKE